MNLINIFNFKSMKRVLFSLKNHKYLSYKPGTIYPECYAYQVPVKNEFTMEKVKNMAIKKGKIDYRKGTKL